MKKRKWGSPGILAVVLLAALFIVTCFWSGAGDGDGRTAMAAENLPEFETAVFGVMTGSTGEFYLEDTYPDAGLQRFENIADGVLALQSGKTDYVLTAYTTALNFIKNDDDIYICKKDVIEETVAIAVNKDNPELYRDVDGMLGTFEEDGTLDQVVSHWIKEDGSGYDPVKVPLADGDDYLNVGIAANREPMCFVQDNEYAGLDCELIEQIAYRLGKKVRYSDMQFSALVAALESGKVDVVISNMTNTPERAEKANFTRDYFSNPQVFLARKQGTEDGSQNGNTSSGNSEQPATSPKPEFQNISEFAGKKVGVETGTIFDQVLKELQPDAIPVYYNSVVDQAEALTGGKIDGIVTDEPVARIVIRDTKGITRLPDSLMDDAYAFVLRKDEAELAEAFNELLEEFKEDGTIEEADRRWFGTDESVKVLPEFDDAEEKKTVESMNPADSSKIGKSMAARGTLVMAVTSTKPPVYLHEGWGDRGIRD